MDNIEALIGRRFERIIEPGYEFDRHLPQQYDGQVEDKPLKKSRYRAEQEKNQLLAKKKAAKRTPGAKGAKSKVKPLRSKKAIAGDKKRAR